MSLICNKLHVIIKFCESSISYAKKKEEINLYYQSLSKKLDGFSQCKNVAH